MPANFDFGCQQNAADSQILYAKYNALNKVQGNTKVYDQEKNRYRKGNPEQL